MTLPTSTPSPIDPFLKEQGVLLLDGGLATEIEARGVSLDSDLWSAKILQTNPQIIYEVHLDYLRAGADCITTATYQASVQGFVNAGFSAEEAKGFMQQAVSLASDARDEFLRESTDEKRLRPLIAASIGPYGAYLANGAEYTGDYGVSNDLLLDFHAERWAILTQTDADLFACETIPSFQEAEVIKGLLSSTPKVSAWISFSCRDGKHISDGTPIKECAALFARHPQIVGIGINCTPPRYLVSLIAEVKADAPDTPVVIYPNSGEKYDGTLGGWLEDADDLDCCQAAAAWHQQGAQLIGGCCRMGPKDIERMRQGLISK